MMTYQEFINRVERNIKTYLNDPIGVSIEIREVHKNNGITLQGMTIKSEGTNIAPTVYLEQFYEQYNQGHEFSEVMSDIATAYENSRKGIVPGFSIEGLEDASIYGELVRTEGNDFLLRDIPSVPIFDGRFTLVFRYDVSVAGVGGSVLVTDSIAAAKNLTTQKLHRLALENKGRQHTPVLKSMGDVLASIMGLDISDTSMSTMYVLGNETMLYGAAMILKEETQQILMERFSGDILVIPSSVHELILLPIDDMDTHMVSSINNMIQEVNRTTVSPDEVLDDEYFILRRTDKGYVFAESLEQAIKT